MNNIRPYILLSSFLILVACVKDKKEISDVLPGRWDLSSAKRGKKITHSLEGTYFIFTSPTEVMTNLVGIDSHVLSYQVEEQVLILDHVSLPSFKIAEYSDSTLQLNMHVQSEDIQLNLIKSP